SSHRATTRGRTAACPVKRDTQAPSAPSALAATATTGNGLAVTWNASSDNVGVAGYTVYQGGARVGTTPATNFTFAPLTCGSVYEIGVEAFDAAGNISKRTTLQAATAACPDTQPPGQPTGLHITASTASSLTLAWGVPTDNVGVTGYRVYLSGVLVA